MNIYLSKLETKELIIKSSNFSGTLASYHSHPENNIVKLYIKIKRSLEKKVQMNGLYFISL